MTIMASAFLGTLLFLVSIASLTALSVFLFVYTLRHRPEEEESLV